MAKCLLKYQWVKLPRDCMPMGKGLLGYWLRLASRAAFRKGEAHYCGHVNQVVPGMWAGGIVGLKRILGVKNRGEVLRIMDKLQELAYISYTLDSSTKKLEYRILDWVIQCSGAECMSGTAYTTEGYGFLCLPRSISQRLAEQSYIFSEADAWLDLWCHTIWRDPRNAFSFLAPTAQFGAHGAVLTLETLGQRWGWEKTKVWRFFRKYGDAFALYRLPGSYGCLIFHKQYPTGAEVSLPDSAAVMRMLEKIRIQGKDAHICGTDHERLNKMVLWYSREITKAFLPSGDVNSEKSRVALSTPITRAYISLCWNCKNCDKDCGSNNRVLHPHNQSKNVVNPWFPWYTKEIYYEQNIGKYRKSGQRTRAEDQGTVGRIYSPAYQEGNSGG